MIKKSFIIILFSSFILQGFSQNWSRYKYEFHYGVGLTNLMADIGAPTPSAPPITQYVWVNFWNTVGFTANAGLTYHLSNRHYVRGTLYMGQLFAKDPAGDVSYWDRGIKASSFFTEISGQYEFMIWQEKKKSTVYRKLGESSFKNFSLPTYLFIGLGGTFNVGKFSKVSADGKYLLNETYTNFSPVIPFGIGFKYKINRLTYVNLEAAWHFTFNDGIDNAKGKENNAYGEWYDQYQTITFNVVHKLRQNQNGSPKFRRR